MGAQLEQELSPCALIIGIQPGKIWVEHVGESIFERPFEESCVEQLQALMECVAYEMRKFSSF